MMIACAVFTTVSMVSFAQSAQTTMSMQAPAANAPQQQSASQGGAEKVAADRAKVHQKNLKLSQEQYKAVYEAELDYARQEQATRAAGAVPGPGQSMQMDMGRDNRFKNAMTAEQYAKYQASKPKSVNAKN